MDHVAGPNGAAAGGAGKLAGAEPAAIVGGDGSWLVMAGYGWWFEEVKWGLNKGGIFR